jgi:hypothetical protein
MRVQPTDIGYAGEVHKLYKEWCQDNKLPIPTPDKWWFEYADSRFFCLLAKHGKKAVGITWGRVERYYEKPIMRLEGFFIRRGFRGKMKFTRGLHKSLVSLAKDNGVSEYVRGDV